MRCNANGLANKKIGLAHISFSLNDSWINVCFYLFIHLHVWQIPPLLLRSKPFFAQVCLSFCLRGNCSKIGTGHFLAFYDHHMIIDKTAPFQNDIASIYELIQLASNKRIQQKTNRTFILKNNQYICKCELFANLEPNSFIKPPKSP